MTVEVVDAPRTGNGVTIENVSVSAENATGAVVTIAATRNGGVWTATIPASHFAAVGVVAMGVTISASGTDENGAARSWIIGKGDLTILPADGVPVPGETLQNVHLRDSVPETPQKGDLCEGANGWQIYTGDAWAEIGGNAPEPSTSAPLMDGTASAGSSAAYARGDHVHPTDTSRMAATATGADIPLAGGDETIYDVMLTKADDIVEVDGQTMPLSDGIVEVNTKIVQHADDTTIHVTATEKATWNGKQSALTAQQLANIAAVPNKLDKSGGEMTGSLSAPQVNITRVGYPTWSMELDNEVGRFHFRAPPLAGVLGSVDLTLPRRTDNLSGTVALAAPSVASAGNLAALDANGNPTDAGWTAGDLARYSLTTKTIDNGAVTLDDRAINAVAVSSSLASLTVNFPTATSGKARDFGLRVEIGTGSAALAAPALVPIAPTGETIKLENPDGAIPSLADGTATAKGVTLLYFSESAPGVFVVKGEQVKAIPQSNS